MFDSSPTLVKKNVDCRGEQQHSFWKHQPVGLKSMRKLMCIIQQFAKGSALSLFIYSKIRYIKTVYLPGLHFFTLGQVWTHWILQHPHSSRVIFSCWQDVSQLVSFLLAGQSLGIHLWAKKKKKIMMKLLRYLGDVPSVMTMLIFFFISFDFLPYFVKPTNGWMPQSTKPGKKEQRYI